MSRRHDSDAPRGLGVISSIAPRAKGFIFAADAQLTEYFVHCSVCRPPELFDALQLGDKVSFAISSAPKGMRAHDVRRMTDEEATIHTQQVHDHTQQASERQGNTEAHGQRQTFVDDLGDGVDFRRRRKT